jgi:hypothetical protein
MTNRGEVDLVCVVGGVHGQTFTFIYNFDARSTHVRRLPGDMCRFLAKTVAAVGWI